MDAFQINKFVGAFLSSLMLLMVISGVGEYLVPAGKEASAGHPSSTPAPTDKTGKPDGGPAAEEGPSFAALLGAASVESGAKGARKCAACHTYDRGGANRIGPNLWNIVGADIGAKDGFAYSPAMANLEGNWTFAALDAFLAKPKAFSPGTKMSFAGVRKAAARADIIAFLRSQSGSPAPLPGE